MSFKDAMRRVITGDDARRTIGHHHRRRAVGRSAATRIWAACSKSGRISASSAPLDPKDHSDLGTTRAVLGPRKGNVQVRWFVVSPLPEGVPKPELDAMVRNVFAGFDGERHIIDQTRHPAMHETHSIDIICLLQGDVSLILEGSETRIKPGQVVIQRGTNHAWVAHGGPALLLAVLVDRPLV